ncbi:DNA polymerase zeta catalytic subunit [Plasmodium gonderi]|uniref:DNA polymerase n=1 Tax=Plasmodium gonderi TaxID=77519 RepID=A0A1Y1JI01_PLAGO|nr:DNA polymerase zeta catalytic subunit [Plasmodium gonderi]GAW80063.1 DNA polymerase zeta catalytic subunit [Plasmodium gonderi]
MNTAEKISAFFIFKFLFFYYIYRKPSRLFDSLVCKINNKKIPHACIIQILGLSHYGQSVCLYVHDFFPFFYVLIPPEEKSNTNLEFEICEFLEEEYGKAKQDKAQNACIYNIERVKKKCIYGYNEEPEEFLKIYFLYPNTINYFASLLKKKLFKNRIWELYEVHISYMLHFLCSKNIYGCSEIYINKNILFRKEFFSKINFECFMEEEKWNLKSKCSIETIKRNKYLYPDAPYFFTDKTTNVNFSNLKRETSYDIECDIKHEDILNHQIYSWKFEKYKRKWKEELNFDLPICHLDSFAKLWMKEKKRCEHVNPDWVREIFNFDDFEKELDFASFDVLTDRTKKLFSDFMKFMRGSDEVEEVSGEVKAINGEVKEICGNTREGLISATNGKKEEARDVGNDVIVKGNRGMERESRLNLNLEKCTKNGTTKMAPPKNSDDNKRKYIASFEINNKRKDIIRYIYKKKPPKIREYYAILSNLSSKKGKRKNENGANEGEDKNREKNFCEKGLFGKDLDATLNSKKETSKNKTERKKMNTKYGNIFFLEILTEVKRENYNSSNYKEDEIKAIFYIVRDERLMNYYDDYTNCVGVIASQPFPDMFPYLFNKKIETKLNMKRRPRVEVCNNGDYICRDMFGEPSDEETFRKEYKFARMKNTEGGETEVEDEAEGGEAEVEDEAGGEEEKVEWIKKGTPLDVNYSNVNIYIAENERDVIKKLIDKINFYSPLSIVSYENDKYNVSYINQRCLALDMGNFYQHISKLNDQKEFIELNNTYNKNIKGILIESLYKLSNISNTSFENLCKYYLNINIPSISKYILYFWYSYEKTKLQNCCKDGSGSTDEYSFYPYRYITIKYFLMKVHFLLFIYDKIGFLKKKMDFCKYIHVDLLSLINRGSQFIIESFLVKLCMKNGFLLYSPSNKEIMNQRPILHTPLVLQPKSSINFFPLLVFDFQSLYPSIVIAFNICYSTCLGTLSYKGRSSAHGDHPSEESKYEEDILEENKIREFSSGSSSGYSLDMLNVKREAEFASIGYNRKAGNSNTSPSDSNGNSDESNGMSNNLEDNLDKDKIVRADEFMPWEVPNYELFPNDQSNRSKGDGNGNRNGDGKRGGIISSPAISTKEESNQSDKNKFEDGEKVRNWEFIRLGVKKKPQNVMKMIKNLKRDDVLITSNNTVYVNKKKRKGICTLFLEDMLKTRIMLKRCIKIYDERRGMRLVEKMGKLKMILNVATGYIGANFSGRMPCVDISESIINTGKNFLLYIIEYIKENYQYIKVLYGDTDSLFLLNEMNDINYSFKIAYDILRNVNSTLPSPVYLNFEKVYCPSVLMTKKRYCGFAYKKESDENPTLDLKGVESIRSDQCNLVKNVLIQIYFMFYYFRNFCYLSYCCCCCSMCNNFFSNFICTCKESNNHQTSPCLLSKMIEAVLHVYRKVTNFADDKVINLGTTNIFEEDTEEYKTKLYDLLVRIINCEKHNVILKLLNYLYKEKYAFLLYIFIRFGVSYFKMEIEKIIEKDYEKIVSQSNDCCIRNPHNIVKICLCVGEINENRKFDIKKCDMEKCFCNIKQAFLFFDPNPTCENRTSCVFNTKIFYSHLSMNIKKVLSHFFNKIYGNEISYDNFILYKKVKLGTYKGELENSKRKVPLPPQAIVAKKLLKTNPHLVITYKEKIPFVITKKLKEDKIYDSVSHPSCIRGIYNSLAEEVLQSLYHSPHEGETFTKIGGVEYNGTSSDRHAENLIQIEEIHNERDIFQNSNKLVHRGKITKNNKIKLKEINFDYYIQNLVIPPLKRMLDLLPYDSPNLEEIFHRTRRTHNWGRTQIDLFSKNLNLLEKTPLKGILLSRDEKKQIVDMSTLGKHDSTLHDSKEGNKKVLSASVHSGVAWRPPRVKEKMNHNESWYKESANFNIKMDEEENERIRKQIVQSFTDINRSQNMVKRLNKICVQCASTEMEAAMCQYAVHCNVYFKKTILQERISKNKDTIRSFIGE